MSEIPSHGSDHQVNPDWWIASDGIWYPPELHPDYVAPAAGAVAGDAAGAAADAGGSLGTAGGAISGATDAAGDAASGLRETVADAGSGLRETVVDAGSGLRETVADAGSGAGGALGSMADRAGDAGGSLMDKAGDVAGGVGDAGGSLMDKAGGALGGVAAGAGALGAGAMASSSDMIDKAKEALSGDAPDLSAPDLSAPDLSAPDLSAPDLSAPDLSAPDLSPPDVTPPDLSVSYVPETPDLGVPAVDAELPDVAPLPDADVVRPAASSVAETVIVSPSEPASPTYSAPSAPPPSAPPPSAPPPMAPPVGAPPPPANYTPPAPSTPSYEPPSPGYPDSSYSSAPSGYAASGGNPVGYPSPVGETPAPPSYDPDPMLPTVGTPKPQSLAAGFLALLAGAAAIIGSWLLDWGGGTVESEGGITKAAISVGGFQSNGQITLACGAVLALAGLLLLFGVPKQLFWAILAFIAGGIIVALTVFSLIDISDLSERYQLEWRNNPEARVGDLVRTSPQLGLWLTGASGVLGVLSAPFVNRI